MSRTTTTRERGRGQATVEFALVLIPFLLLLFGMLDLGRGIYTYNATAQAAREIAREASVHPYDTCCVLGSSTSVTAIKQAQQRQVPGLTEAGITISCVDIRDAPIAAADCRPGDFLKVAISVPFDLLTPLLGELGPFTLASTSRIEWP